MSSDSDIILKFIASQQQDDGSFLSESFPMSGKSNSITYKTTFLTSLILYAIRDYTSLQAQEIKDKALRYLMSQRSETGSWNYWGSSSPEYTKRPYPDDLDDTFCALIAIQQTKPELLTGELLAKTISLLTTVEKQAGGPYKTWLTNNKASAWHDVDLVVNSNISFFLKSREISLTSISKLIDTAIDTSTLKSPYYPSEHAVLYFVSRAADNDQKERLIAHATALSESNQLEKILKALTLSNLGYSVNKIHDISDTILPTRWEVNPFCIDPVRDNATYAMGAQALNAALYLELIAESHTAVNASPKLVASQKTFAFLRQRFTFLPLVLRNYITELFRKRLKDATVLAALPHYFQQALGVKCVTGQQLTKLSAATLCGWLAYTIYDDFLDDEGVRKQLPVANIVLRESIELYAEQLAPFTPYRYWMDDVFDRLEAANFWEVTHCRFAIVNDRVNARQLKKLVSSEMPPLSDRSLGHLLSPIAILAYAEYNLHDKVVTNTIKFFEAYLTARQLSDDAHDWKEDLRRGQLNSVSRELIRNTDIQNMSIDELIEVLDKQLWSSYITKLTADIDEQIQLATDIVTKQQVFQKPEVLLALLKPIELANLRTKHEYDEAKAFISSYRQGSTVRN